MRSRRSRLMFGTIFIHAIFVSVTLSLNDDLLFDDTSLQSYEEDVPFDPSLDQSASLFNSAELPEDSPYSTDVSPSPLGQTPALADDDVLNNSFQPADCSASEYLPTIGKKVRRLDDPGLCKTPATPLGTTSGSANDADGVPDALKLFILGGSGEIQQNPFCYMKTSGVLPWGVCSSGNSQDDTYSIRNMFNGHVLWTLNYCTVGTRRNLVCRVNSDELRFH